MKQINRIIYERDSLFSIDVIEEGKFKGDFELIANGLKTNISRSEMKLISDLLKSEFKTMKRKK